MKDVNGRITVDYLDQRIECPFCMQRIPVKVSIELSDGNVRQSSSTSFTNNFSVDVHTKIVGVHLEHDCAGPKEEI